MSVGAQTMHEASKIMVYIMINTHVSPYWAILIILIGNWGYA